MSGTHAEISVSLGGIGSLRGALPGALRGALPLPGPPRGDPHAASSARTVSMEISAEEWPAGGAFCAGAGRPARVVGTPTPSPPLGRHASGARAADASLPPPEDRLSAVRVVAAGGSPAIVGRWLMGVARPVSPVTSSGTGVGRSTRSSPARRPDRKSGSSARASPAKNTPLSMRPRMPFRL